MNKIYIVRGIFDIPDNFNIWSDFMNLYEWCIDKNRADLWSSIDVDENLRNGIDVYNLPPKYRKTVYCKCTQCGGNFTKTLQTLKDRGVNCPYCSHRTSKKIVRVGVNDLLTMDMQLASEWAEDLNGKLASEVLFNTSAKGWWRCKKCNNTWEAQVSTRYYQHTGCPYCINQKVKKGYNDLASQYPDLLKEWDYEKNTVSPDTIIGTTLKNYWWKCKICGKSWKTSPSTRIRQHTGCPNCQALHTSYPEQFFFKCFERLNIGAINRYKIDGVCELDIYLRDIGVGIEYDSRYHTMDYSERRELSKYNYCKQKGIHLIRVKTHSSSWDNSVADKLFYVSERADKDGLVAVFKKLFTYINNISEIKNVNISFDDVERESRLASKRINYEDSLEYLYPNLAKEYSDKNIVKASEIHSGSSKKVLWVCRFCGNLFEVPPKVRLQRIPQGISLCCSSCSKKKLHRSVSLEDIQKLMFRRK